MTFRLALQATGFLQIANKNCLFQHIIKRGFLYSWKKGISRDTVVWLQQPINLSPSAIRGWIRKKEWQALLSDHRYIPERHKALGPDLAAAHFVVARDGAVKFEGIERWIMKNAAGKYYLPSTAQMNMRLEAIDASNTKMVYSSFDNFSNLKHLKYLRLSNCPYVDDWCLDRFVQFRETLLVLELSGCTAVTERGLATLHKLYNLRRLILYNMPNVRNRGIVAVMLEEAMPNCVVEGIDFTSVDHQNITDINNSSPTFLQQWEDFAHRKERERAVAAEKDGTLAVVDEAAKKQSRI